MRKGAGARIDFRRPLNPGSTTGVLLFSRLCVDMNMNKTLPVLLMWLSFGGCGTSVPLDPDASISAGPACSVPERTCQCADFSTGRQVCFEPSGAWSQCACQVTDAGSEPVQPDAGTAAQDAGRQIPDGGLAACPPTFACRATAQGIGICLSIRTQMAVSCPTDGTSCEQALPGSMCRTVMNRDLCIRLCQAEGDGGVARDGGRP
jgi:hypothetical protein